MRGENLVLEGWKLFIIPIDGGGARLDAVTDGSRPICVRFDLGQQELEDILDDFLRVRLG